MKGKMKEKKRVKGCAGNAALKSEGEFWMKSCRVIVALNGVVMSLVSHVIERE